MEKLAVLDILNVTTERHVNRYFALMLTLGPDHCVFYCSDSFFKKFPQQAAKLESAGIKTVINDYEQSFKHKYHLASTHCREYTIKRAEPIVDWTARLDARGTRFIYHPVSSEEVYPNAAEFPAGSYILYPFERTFFNGIGQGKYLLDAAGTPVVGRTDHGVEGLVVGSLHLTEEVLALSRRDRSELKNELEERLQVKFRPDLPLILYMISHYIETSQADRGLMRLAESANIVIKGLGPDISIPPPTGADECYSRATGENIFPTCDSSLNSLMRFAADFNLMSFHSSAMITSLMLGLRAIPVCSNHFLSYVPKRQTFNLPFLFRDPRLIGVTLAWNICPAHIRATELIVEKMNDPAYWEAYEYWLPKLRQYHLGRYWLGDEALKRAAEAIGRVLAEGTFAPADTSGYKIASGAPKINPPFDFFHECLL